MKTLDKYLIREMISPFLVGALIVLVLWIGNIVFYQVSALKGRTDLLPVFLRYVLLKSTSYITLSLAAGSLFGAALAVSRLTRDTEITVMRVAGTSVRRIFVPILAFGVVVSGLAYLVQEKVVPWAEEGSVETLNRLYSVQGPPPIQADVFFNWQGYYFYIQNIRRVGRDAELTGITIWELPAGQGHPMIITAKTASWRGQTITMKDGVIHRLGKDGFMEYEARFQSMSLNILQTMTSLFRSEKQPEQMSAGELAKQIEQYTGIGVSASTLPLDHLRNLKTEYHFKLSIPLSSIILILCAAPLGLRFGRHSSFAGALMGVVVVFLYWNVLLFAKLFAQAGWLPAGLAGWSQVILFSIVGVILIWKAE